MEVWQLDAKMRKMPNLPVRSVSRNKCGDAPHHRVDCCTVGALPIGIRRTFDLVVGVEAGFMRGVRGITAGLIVMLNLCGCE